MSHAPRPLSLLSRAFRMTDGVWARHQNPASVWTRAAILPVLTLTLAMREPLGPMFGPALAALALWTWANPRAFPPPADPATWSARAVRGERVWVETPGRLPPAARARLARRTALSALPAPVWIWAVIADRPAVAMAAALAIVALKLRFLQACAELADAVENGAEDRP